MLTGGQAKLACRHGSTRLVMLKVPMALLSTDNMPLHTRAGAVTTPHLLTLHVVVACRAVAESLGSCCAHFERLQFAPAPSHSSTLCCPPSSSRDLSTPSNRLRLSVTEARPPLLLLAGVLGVLLLPGLAAEAGVPEGGGPPRYFTTARVL
jgi:hypothetical protein